MSVEVVAEPPVYERRAQQIEGVSWFRDLIFRDSDREAALRLERHSREVEPELRVTPNRTQAQVGYFAPPLWLIDQFATAPRAGRRLAKLIDAEGNLFPLPQGVQSVNLPRLTTGNAEGGVADDADDASADAVDAASTSPVVTISGQADVALPLLEQSPAGAHLDMAFFRDLTEAYDQALETMLINGSGPNTQPTTQFTGLLNLSGTNSVTYTSASPTATGMFTFLGQNSAQIGKNRKHPPEAWLMTTSRASWLGSSEDTSSRPLMIADNTTESGSFDLLAFEVAMDDAIPTTLGAGGNQDVIILCRPKDLMLFESAQMPRVMMEPLSGSLGVRIQLCGYAAFICRYPTGGSILSGTGLVVQ